MVGKIYVYLFDFIWLFSFLYILDRWCHVLSVDNTSSDATKFEVIGKVHVYLFDIF